MIWVCTLLICPVKTVELSILHVYILGTEIESDKFIQPMDLLDNTPSDYEYPPDRLHKLRCILFADEIC